LRRGQRHARRRAQPHLVRRSHSLTEDAHGPTGVPAGAFPHVQLPLPGGLGFSSPIPLAVRERMMIADPCGTADGTFEKHDKSYTFVLGHLGVVHKVCLDLIFALISCLFYHVCAFESQLKIAVCSLLH